MDERIRAEYRFQLEHGGMRVGHQAEDALERARARVLLHDLEDAGRAAIQWEHDPDPDVSWLDERGLEELRDGTTEILQGLVTIDGRTAAIGGVHVYARGHGGGYLRVLEAELTGEILEEIRGEEREERARWAAVGVQL